MPVKPLTVGMVGENIAALHRALTTLGFSIPEAETRRQFFGPGTREAIKHCQARSGLTPSGICDEATGALLNLPDVGGAPPARLRSAAPAIPSMPEARSGNGAVEAGARTFTVEGKVFSRVSAGFGMLRVRIVDKNVGDDMLLAEAITGEDGAYQAIFTDANLRERSKANPDLQARVFSGDTFVGASEVRYNASNRETLNVLLNEKASAALPSEHETLTSSISTHFTGRLGDLKESGDRQDITYLANKTGWDARAVALAALADQFSQRSGKAVIPAVFYYALFRAGLPANEDILYHTDAQTLGGVWKKAAENGVIPKALTQAIPQMVERFRTLSAQKLLTGPALIGASSLKEMLTVSGLDDARQEMFAGLYTANRSDMPKFWGAVTNAFGKEVADRLQVDGKLGFLTINNALLIQALRTAAGGNGLSDPAQLAQLGFHRADKWGTTLTSNIPIPKEIPGDTPEAKRANYAEYLAAQVRLSYPTASVAQMVRSGELPLTGAAPGVVDQTHAFLSQHQGKFEIGAQPVEQYIAKNKLKVSSETVAQVKRLQRVYQITPNDQAMIGLMKNGIDAAYHVVRYEKEAFIKTYGQEVGGPEIAAQIYDKSAQTHNAVLNVAISYLAAKNGIGLGARPFEAAQQDSDGAGLILQPAPAGPTPENASDVIAYPTLEGLFGEMDFCACDHCRSVLSPAAYLVDLLLFIDQEPTEAGKVNPQAVLFDRRPDIQHLPLTCENTNTELPYIDVVNETLEYFIANNTQKLSLKDYVGHDTGGAASEDLLASPQFVMDSAYATLRDERFPAPAPFHQPLENLRRYFEKFGALLPLAMERFRKSDDLESGANAYGWRDILMEEIGLSRAEGEILTDSNAVPLWRMYGFPYGTADAAVIAALSNAKQFTRRVGITYEEIVAVLMTRFVNPNSDLIPKLERLGVSFATLKALKDGTITDAAFDALLPAGAGALDPAVYGGDIKAWVKDDANHARIMGLITLIDPTGASDPCNFDPLEFRYSRPTANETDTSTRLGAVEFARLLRFIRLWKKTGWAIEQTDAAICSLFRTDLQPLNASDVDTLAKLDDGFRTLLPRIGVIVRVMKALNLTPERDLLSLLACWSEIGTHGGGPLYRQMFLNPVILKQDAVFANNGFGEYLADNTKKLAGHAEALRSAFNLTGDEYDRIVAALGYDANTLLTLPNISAIFRRAYLARSLRLSVREFLLLTSLTGLDPFAAPDPPNPAILQLITLVQALKDMSLKSAAALYLIWNQDLSGKSAPAPAQITELARTLRGDFASIEDQFAATEDPGGDVARARMALVYGQEAADAFFALLDDTLVVDVAYTHSSQALEDAITEVDTKISYDDFRHRLSRTGLLTAATQTALKNVEGVSEDFKNAVDALSARSEDAKGSFFALYPELRPLYDDYIASTDPPEAKRVAILASFRPELSRRRKRQQALQRLSAAAAIDLTATQTLLDPSAGPYPLHARGHADQPALNDVLALETPGLAAMFHFRDTATGAIDLSVPAAANLDYAVGSANPLPANPTPGAAVSGVWSGQLETPEAGFYNFVIEADAGAAVTLTLGGQVRALTRNGNIFRNADLLELKAGTLYDIELKVEKIKGRLSVKWETPKRAREVIPSRYLYPPTILAPFTGAYVRFLKAASLAAGLGLTANEIAWFGASPDYLISGDGWLNALPAPGDPAAQTAVALLKPLRDLLDYARIKAELSPGDESLLTILQDPGAATAGADSLLLTLARWDRISLDDLLAHFGGDVASLASFDLFRRVYDAFSLIQKMGISASALIDAATNEPTGETTRDLQAALRARYAAADWRDVVQPINDAMRGLQRDALVAYILHQMRSNPQTEHIDTAEKLFEYFLMDVQMGPCMRTSRVRNALSSVQLFIERCLMNLEPRVAPSSINAKQWEWMKRYRVWEANRKVFLYPENWLEPELRDDQSPFFRETMSELLQGDVTEERAAVALLNYLSKLEEVAGLEPCGIHYVENNPGANDGIAHVVARTAGANRKYYYRRCESGSWTPWEEIKLEIEDNPALPVIWKGRLFLFWLRILKQAPLSPPPQLPKGNLADVEASSLVDPNATKIKAQAILCWSERYNGKWQPTRTSDIGRPLELGQFDSFGSIAFDRSMWKLSVFFPTESRTEGAIRIIVSDAIGEGVSFLLYNAHSSPELEQGTSVYFKPERTLGTSGDNTLYITYPEISVGHQVVRNDITDRTVEPHHPVSRDAPFFYEDSRHVFYVTTTLRILLAPEVNDYGGSVFPQNNGDQAPPLVIEEDPRMGDGADTGRVPLGPNPGLVDPVPIKVFVSENANINKGIGTTGEARYGETVIGPEGGRNNTHRS